MKTKPARSEYYDHNMRSGVVHFNTNSLHKACQFYNKSLLLIIFTLGLVSADAQELSWVLQLSSTADNHSSIDAIAEDQWGNIIVAGDFRGEVDFDPGIGVVMLASEVGDDLYVAKYSDNGILIWVRQLSGSGFYAEISDLRVDHEGDIVLVGNFFGTVDFDPGPETYNLDASFLSDIFTCKLNSSGEFIWAKQFYGGGFDTPEGLAIDPEGNIYLTGYFEGSVDFNPDAAFHILTSGDDYSTFFCKLSSYGSLEWAQILSETERFHGGKAISIDQSGDIYVTGSFQGESDFDPGPDVVNLSATGYEDVFIAKFNQQGSLIWAKQLGGQGYETASSIWINQEGHIYLAGHFDDKSDFDPSNEVYNLDPVGFSDGFIVKLDDGGDFQWVHGFGGIFHDEILSVAGDMSGNVYVTGFYRVNVNLVINQIPETLESNGADDIFLIKYSPLGEAIDYLSVGGESEDAGHAVLISNNGVIYLAGNFSEAVDFSPEATAFNLVSTGEYDGFLAKYSDHFVGIFDLNHPHSGILSTTIINDRIEWRLPESGLYQIVNPDGIIIHHFHGMKGDVISNPTGTPPGLYLIREIRSNSVQRYIITD